MTVLKQRAYPIERRDDWSTRPRAIELFAGVGGFRLGLERAGWNVVWSNQWEPSTPTRQHASLCYVTNWGDVGHVCRDIAAVLTDIETLSATLPEHQLIVGGFPCQDYSVATTLSLAHGLLGQRGELWWQIHRLVKREVAAGRRPWLLLENVDRLLKSPSHQRGRDFAVMLASLSELGYDVEWRVINAAAYGAPQRRRRLFIVARPTRPHGFDPVRSLIRDGVLARAFPIDTDEDTDVSAIELETRLHDLSSPFASVPGKSPFLDGGVLQGRRAWTASLRPYYRGQLKVLRDVLMPDALVPDEYYVQAPDIPEWKRLKEKKSIRRTHKASGVTYLYSEGTIPFPDPLDRPSRTILRSEGGRTPSRFKHVVETAGGRLRRLTPVELERLNGFPDGWTDTEMTAPKRAFMMGNAIVIDMVIRAAGELERDVIGAVADRVDRAGATSPSVPISANELP